MRKGLRLWFVALVLLALALGLTGTAVAEEQTGLLPIVRFEGIVDSRPTGQMEGTWTISGQQVEVVAATRIVERQGPAEIGARVVVNASRSEEELTAIQIRVVESAEVTVTIRGIVREMLDEEGRTYLVVNGLKVEYNDGTETVGDLDVGALVRIEALVAGAGSTATHIEVLGFRWIPKVVEFEGSIDSIDGSTWVVDGHEFTVGDLTLIIGPAEVDRHAEVRALEQSDGTLIALWIRIRVEPETTTWEGRIDRLPWLPWGFWVVDGQSVMVTPATEVTGLEPEVGLWARVDAERRNSLPWHAVKIEVMPAPSAGTAKPEPSNN